MHVANDSKLFNFFNAARIGDVEMMARLLSEDISLLQLQDDSSNGRTALMISATKGHESVCLLLVANGANVDHQSSDSETALHIASAMGWYNICQLLVGHGANLNFQDREGKTALMLGSEAGHRSICQILLENGALVDLKDKDGNTALMLAVKNPNESICLLLLTNGADVNALNKHASSALQRASAEGHTVICTLLLEHNADACIHQQNKEGKTALMFASENGHASTCQVLLGRPHSLFSNLEDKQGCTALMLAAFRGQELVCQILVKSGVNLNAKSYTNKTALMYAYEGGHSNIAKLLQSAALTLNSYFTAARNGDDASLRIVCSENSWVLNVKNYSYHEYTALLLASSNGHERICQILIEFGANINIQSKNGDTALQRASAKGHDSICQLLIDQKAKMDLQSKWGETALMLAAGNGHTSICELLIGKNASVDLTDNNGCTALILASINGQAQVCQVLVNSGANISIQSCSGKTALVYARQQQHSTAAKVIEEALTNQAHVANICQPPPDCNIPNLWNVATERGMHIEHEDIETVTVGINAADIRSRLPTNEVAFVCKEIAWSELKMEAVIGQGSFGVVSKADWRGMEVAVKKLKLSTSGLDTSCAEDLKHEAQLLAQVCNHSCVVDFVGVAFSPLAVITRFMSNGSVEQLLVQSKKKVQPGLIIQMALEAAKGVRHLHAEGIIHRDIAARNLLVDEYMHVKVADFGFARVLEEWSSQGFTKSDVGPIKWMAPEAMMNKMYSEQSDVFSFGVTLYEMFTRRTPWDGIENLNVVVQVCAGHRLFIPNEVDPKFKKLIEDCWSQEPTSRITFPEIIETLGSQYSRTLANEESSFTIAIHDHMYTDFT